MTVYNSMYRCEGGQQRPASIILSSQGRLGECPKCGKFFKRYPNGKVIMHKRPSQRILNLIKG